MTAMPTTETTDEPWLPVGEQPESLRRSVGSKLVLVSRHLTQLFNQKGEQAGLSRAKFSIIVVVARRPGATQRTIAEVLGVTEVTAGRMIERLCTDGLLERRIRPDDRR